MQVWCLTWHASGRRASDASLRSQAAACRCETAPAGSFLGVTAMGSGSQCQGSRNEVSPAGVAQRHAGCGSGWGGNPPAPWHCARQSVLVLTVSYSSSKLLVCDAQGKLRIAEDEGCKIVLADSAWHRRQLSTDMHRGFQLYSQACSDRNIVDNGHGATQCPRYPLTKN